jgi:hypothetical protein
MLGWEQRLQLDLIALHATKCSSHDLVSAAEGNVSMGTIEEAAVQLHLCCLETLLVSVVTPSAARPAFLPQAMHLFKEVSYRLPPHVCQVVKYSIPVLTSLTVLTSAPFGDSVSAAARPKRWGVFRQAKD